MLEIDDKYQEYAPAHCPPGSGRHYIPKNSASAVNRMRRERRLMMSRKGFLTGVGVLILVGALVGSPFAARSMEQPSPPAQKTTINSPEPTPDPVPEPTPIPTPEPTTESKQEPTTEPITEKAPEPTTTTPTTEPTTEPEIEPETPEPTTEAAPELLPPVFTDLVSEHEIELNSDLIPEVDIFHYAFTIDLKDADTSKSVSVRLQLGSVNGSGWQDCALDLSYAGSGKVWSDELAYDAEQLDIDSSDEVWGVIKQARIVCDYTLKDGTNGTVYSTDFGELYAYKGEYVTENADSEGYTAAFDDDGLHASFRIMTDLIPDPSKVRLTDKKVYEDEDPHALLVYIGNDAYYITSDKLTMSAPAADGTFMVFCPWDAILPDGVAPEFGVFDFIELNLTYNDKNDAIDWDSTGWGFIHPYTMIHEPPEFTSVTHSRTFNPGIDAGEADTHYYPFEIDLKDADISKPVTARLQIADPGESWEDCPSVGGSVVSVTYSGTGDTWTCEDLAFDILAYNLGDFTGALKNVRIVVDYTMPDGTEGTLYSEDGWELYAYSGYYLTDIDGYLTDDNTVTGIFQIDTGLVQDMSKLVLEQVILYSYYTGGYDRWDITEKISDTSYEDNGNYTVSCTLTDEVIDPGRDNYLEVVFVYNDHGGAISNWRSIYGVAID